jgi:hypothetical protein
MACETSGQGSTIVDLITLLPPQANNSGFGKYVVHFNALNIIPPLKLQGYNI